MVTPVKTRIALFCDSATIASSFSSIEPVERAGEESAVWEHLGRGVLGVGESVPYGDHRSTEILQHGVQHGETLFNIRDCPVTPTDCRLPLCIAGRTLVRIKKLAILPQSVQEGELLAHHVDENRELVSAHDVFLHKLDGVSPLQPVKSSTF